MAFSFRHFQTDAAAKAIRFCADSVRKLVCHAYRRTHAEYDEGDYERSFTISEGLDAGKVKASMKNGLLILELPPAEAARPKQIKVSAA